VYGGWCNTTETPAEPRFLVLDMSTENWRWEVPEQQPSGCRWGHAAVMLPGDVMLVSGGKVRSEPQQPYEESRDVRLYDVAEKRWVHHYPRSRNSLISPPESKRKGTTTDQAWRKQKTKKLSSGAVAGIAIGASLGVLAIIAAAITFCPRGRCHSKPAIAATSRKRMPLSDDEDGNTGTWTVPKSRLRPSSPSGTVPSLDLSDASEQFTATGSTQRRASCSATDATSTSNPFIKEEYELQELQSTSAVASEVLTTLEPTSWPAEQAVVPVTRPSTPVPRSATLFPILSSSSTPNLTLPPQLPPPVALGRSGSTSKILRAQTRLRAGTGASWYEHDDLTEHNVEIGIPMPMEMLHGSAKVVELGSRANSSVAVDDEGILEAEEESVEGGDGCTLWRTANEKSERMLEVTAESDNASNENERNDPGRDNVVKVGEEDGEKKEVR
jgi:hypothetical protein